MMSVADGRIEQRPWFCATDSGLDAGIYKAVVVLVFARRVVIFSDGCMAADSFQYRYGFLERIACEVALFISVCHAGGVLIRNALHQIVQIAANSGHRERNDAIIMGRDGGTED